MSDETEDTVCDCCGFSGVPLIPASAPSPTDIGTYIEVKVCELCCCSEAFEIYKYASTRTTYENLKALAKTTAYIGNSVLEELRELNEFLRSNLLGVEK